MLSETNNHTQILISKRYPITQQYIKPSVFLSSKQNTPKPTYQITEQPKLPNYYKKYFGHKISCVTKYSQLVSAIHSQKSFKNIFFNEDICEMDQFRTNNESVMLSHDIEIPKKCIKKAIKGLRGGKVSITFESNVDVSKFIKNNMSRIRHVEIILQKEIQQLTYNRSTFEGLRSLESFSLSFEKEFDKSCGEDDKIDQLSFDPSSYQQNPFSFLLLLLKKTQLKKLSINLCPYPLAPETLSYLLLSIEQANIPVWYFKTGMESQDLMTVANGMNIQGNKAFPLQFTNSSQVIQKIDFLGLYALNYVLDNRYGEWDCDDCFSYEYSPPRLLDIPELVSNSRRVLDITFTDYDLMKTFLNIRALLQNFSSLEGLYMKAVEDVLTFEKASNEPEELGWTKNLKKALFSIVDVYYRDTCFSIYDQQSQSQAFTKLMELMKANCQVLESLNIFRSFPIYYNNHGVTYRHENEVTIPSESLTGFETIRELELNTDHFGFWGATRMFESLKNLTKLRLNICDNSTPFTLDEKQEILDGLKNLKEFELVIRPELDAVKKDCSVHWAKYFAKNIEKLKNLEVLRILDSKDTKVQFEVFVGLVSGLSQMKTLREVVIQSKVVKNPEAIETAAELSGDSIENVESRMIDNLQARVDQIVSLNPNLKLLNIYSFENMRLDHIFYSK